MVFKRIAPKGLYISAVAYFAFMVLLSFFSAAFAATATLTWNAPTTNEDGSTLTDLAGYKIHYGPSSGNYTNLLDAGNTTTYQVDNLTAGETYYFSVTAYDTSGNESLYSNEASSTIPLPSLPDIRVTDSVAPTGDLQVPFGSVTEGNSKTATVTITNDGSTDLVISSVGVSDPLLAPFAIEADTCSGQTLLSAASCTLTVRFSPVSTGPFSDSFDIRSNDPDESSVTVSVTGTGTAPPTPDIRVTDSVAPTGDLQVPFGSVTEGNSKAATVTVTNDGNADLAISSVGMANPLIAPFGLETDTCSGQTLLPAASCTVTVRFSPVSTGTFSDSFDMQSNDPDESSVTVSVTGAGTAPLTPDIGVTDSAAPADDRRIDFVEITVGNSSVQQVTISNKGNTELVIGAVAGINPLSFPFGIQSDGCSGKSLAPSGSCVINVLFAPSTDGAFNDSFDIPSNDPDEPQITLSMGGTGLPAVVNNPPSEPTPIYPAKGQKDLGSSVKFRWVRSTDPDGNKVKYKLYLSEDPSFTNSTVISVASFRSQQTLYAGAAWYAAGLLLAGTVFAGGLRSRRRIILVIMLVALAGMSLVSCGGGGETSSVSPAPVTDEISQDVQGLVPASTYYWKVIATDELGASSASEVRDFATK